MDVTPPHGRSQASEPVDDTQRGPKVSHYQMIKKSY